MVKVRLNQIKTFTSHFIEKFEQKIVMLILLSIYFFRIVWRYNKGIFIFHDCTNYISFSFIYFFEW